jgi:hypothetical protein
MLVDRHFAGDLSLAFLFYIKNNILLIPFGQVDFQQCRYSSLVRSLLPAVQA